MSILDNLIAVMMSLTSNPITDVENTYKIEADPQIACLAQNMYFEARNESTAGQIAVTNVVLNRTKSNKFPNTPCEVIYQAKYSKWWLDNHNKYVPVLNKCQFSWYCDGKSDEIYNRNKYNDLYLLASIVYNLNLDLTDGATFYHADYVSPKWAQQMEQTATIDTHLFFAER